MIVTIKIDEIPIIPRYTALRMIAKAWLKYHAVYTCMFAHIKLNVINQ